MPVHPTSQWVFLQAVEQYIPEAMTALAAIDVQDDQIQAWCSAWGFTGADQRDWLRAVAQRTADWLHTKPSKWPNSWVFLSSEWGDVQEWQSNEATIAHLGMLARYQVGHWTLERIAEKYRGQLTRLGEATDLAAVKGAIESAAELAGVRLRADHEAGT